MVEVELTLGVEAAELLQDFASSSERDNPSLAN